MPFTPGQLAAIQQTVQQSVAKALHSQHSQAVSDTIQPFHSFPPSFSGLQQRRPGTATPLGFQRALEKSTEDKILRVFIMEVQYVWVNPPFLHVTREDFIKCPGAGMLSKLNSSPGNNYCE